MSEEAVWKILLEIKEDAKTHGQVLEKHLEEVPEDRAHLRMLCTQVQQLNKLITLGNGQESVLTKLARVETEISEVKTDIKENRENVRSLVQVLITDKETPHVSKVDVSKVRWVAVSKIAIFLALLVPGFLAFFGFN